MAKKERKKVMKFFIFMIGLFIVAVFFVKDREKQEVVTYKIVGGQSCDYKDFKKFHYKELKESNKNFSDKEWLDKYKVEELLPVIFEKYGDIIRDVCVKEKIRSSLKTGYDAAVITAIESSGGKLSDNLMQVSDSAAIVVGVDPDSLKIPRWNFVAGLRYLNAMLDSLNDDLPAALIAYNCGLKNYRNNYKNAGVDPKDGEYYQRYKCLMNKINKALAKAE
jgi:hypothetical protein